ncbi:MAG: hypothetical protein JRJ78_15245 [Deltaproteobacteria bacterium]|nr:hypothetical protein [Deltaproteobacteria bacterium]
MALIRSLPLQAEAELFVLLANVPAKQPAGKHSALHGFAHCGFWPFICPDSGPKYARYGENPKRLLSADLQRNLNLRVNVMYGYSSDFRFLDVLCGFDYRRIKSTQNVIRRLISCMATRF